MTIIRNLSIWLMLSFSVGMQAQSEKPVTVTPKPAKAAYYVDSAVLDVGVFLPEPPAADSAANHARVRSRPSFTTGSSHVKDPTFIASEQALSVSLKAEGH